VAVDGAFGPDVMVFRFLGRTAYQRQWLARLPHLVTELEDRWQLRTGMPYPGGSSSWVAPAIRRDGTPAVLKVAWPHRESRGEALALRLWDGVGVPRLLAADAAANAMLLERCEPGTPLRDSSLRADERLDAGAAVLRSLWRDADSLAVDDEAGLERVEDVCAGWAELARDRMRTYGPPFDRGLVERGIQLLIDLPRSAERNVVVHGDANPGNILAARRAPWLMIDAKPMVGDPGYDPFSLLLQVAEPLAGSDPVRTLVERTQRLAALLDLPPERILAWALARGVESALWHVSEDDLPGGSEECAVARLVAEALDHL
jgi:streptomycin 6-kinase